MRYLKIFIFLGCVILFSYLFAFFSSYINSVVKLEKNIGVYNLKTFYKPKFYGIERDGIDVVFFGSSIVYSDINPFVIWDEQGIPSYNLSGSGQNMWDTYFYIKECLKYLTPKVIVVDVFMATNSDNASSIINTFGMKSSREKIELKKISSRKKLKIGSDLYRNESKDLYKEDFIDIYTDSTPFMNGYFLSYNMQPFDIRPNVSSITVSKELPDKQLEYLMKIIDLTKEQDIKLLLVVSPFIIYDDDEQKIFNSVEQIAVKNNIEFINYNLLYDEIQLDFQTDIADARHLNYYGSKKFSTHLANALKNKYLLKNKKNDSDYSLWSEVTQTILIPKITNIYEYLDAISGERYSIFIGMKDEASQNLNQSIVSKLFNLGLEINLEGQWFMSYLAVINEGQLIYESAGNNTGLAFEDIATKAALRHSGTLSNGTRYKMFSSATAAGRCSIIINGTEYAVNDRGLNFVVYDNYSKRVVDSVCFDTWADTLDARRGILVYYLKNT
jgi:hypothetical protein